MVTNDAHPLALHPHGTAAATEGFGGRVMDRLRQVVCGLHGHDSLVQFAQDRLYLRCVSCGYETPGWDLEDKPRVTIARPEQTRRPALAHAQLISERRIA